MRRKIITFAVALVCITATSTSGVVAQDAAVESAAATSDDIAAYATHHQISRSMAESELDELPRIAAMQTLLSTKSSEIFGGIWISHEPTLQVNVALVGDQPGHAARLAAEFGIKARVEQLTVERSYKQLLGVADDLREQRQVFDHVVRIDMRNNRVFVQAINPAAYVARADGRAAQLAGVTIEKVPMIGGPSVGIYGGLSTPTCTLGWTVRKNGTTTDGITTAAHCPDTQTYLTINLPFQASANGSADAQWHTTPGFTDEPRFKVNFAGEVRVVTSITSYSSVIVGQTICKYGQATGYGCGEVEEKEADAHWVPNQSGRYISLKRCDTDLSTGGDSGGPVFYNLSAFGIVSGWQFGGLLCNDELVFASVSYVQSGLNVTVKLP